MLAPVLSAAPVHTSHHKTAAIHCEITALSFKRKTVHQGSAGLLYASFPIVMPLSQTRKISILNLWVKRFFSTVPANHITRSRILSGFTLRSRVGRAKLSGSKVLPRFFSDISHIHFTEILTQTSSLIIKSFHFIVNNIQSESGSFMQ